MVVIRVIVSVAITIGYADFDFILSYEQLGEASASYKGEVTDSELFHQALVNSGPKLVDGISIQARYTLWQSKVFKVKGAIVP